MRGWPTIIAKINGSLDLEKASCDLIEFIMIAKYTKRF